MESHRPANPYDWVGEVTDPNQFAGRSSEIDLITERLLQIGGDHQPPIISMTGERRVGKSSILHRITEFCNELIETY